MFNKGFREYRFKNDGEERTTNLFTKHLQKTAIDKKENKEGRR